MLLVYVVELGLKSTIYICPRLEQYWIQLYKVQSKYIFNKENALQKTSNNKVCTHVSHFLWSNLWWPEATWVLYREIRYGSKVRHLGLNFCLSISVAVLLQNTKNNITFSNNTKNVEIVDHNHWKVCHNGARFKITTMHMFLAIM